MVKTIVQITRADESYIELSSNLEGVDIGFYPYQDNSYSEAGQTVCISVYKEEVQDLIDALKVVNRMTQPVS